MHKLTPKHVLDFLSTQKLMSVATFGDFPWIASVYYTYNKKLELFFLSDPATLHCTQIAQNPLVAVAIADSSQSPRIKKKGLQVSGVAEQISYAAKVRHALNIWKKSQKITDPELSYENMTAQVVTGRMYKITPKRIKLFDQALFDADDGQEPVLILP